MQMWMPHYPLAYQGLAKKNIIWGGGVYVDFVFFSKNAGTFNWTQWTHKVNEANNLSSWMHLHCPWASIGTSAHSKWSGASLFQFTMMLPLTLIRRHRATVWLKWFAHL
jgi:hypothetical protein